MAVSNAPHAFEMPAYARASNVGHVKLSDVIPDPNQPRKDFDQKALARLARTIKRYGQLVPIRVRRDPESSHWMIVSGERRYHAAKLAGLKVIQCVFDDQLSDPAKTLELQLIENCLREDLRPIEQARAFRAVMEAKGWSGNRLSKEIGLSQATVATALRTLGLPVPIQEMVDRGEVPRSVAYHISRLHDPVKESEIVDRIASEGLNRDAVIRLVRETCSRQLRGQRPHQGWKEKSGKRRRSRIRTISTASAIVRVTLLNGTTEADLLAALDEAKRVVRRQSAESN